MLFFASSTVLFLCAPRILAGLIIFAGYLLNEQGLIGLLLAGDRSGISYLIAAIWLAMTLRWLWLLRWVQRQYDMPVDFETAHREAVLARWLNHGWFAADKQVCGASC